MVDVKKLWIWVHTTGVKKGWDWVELPDGRRVSVPEGKYIKVSTIDGKTAIGFEDLTEEIGEKPDWDYHTPLCVVDEVVDGIQKAAKLRCKFTGRYHVSLFYEGSKVAEFWWGKTFDTPSLSYIDVQTLAKQLPVPPAFDYIIDIYSDKIVIIASDGSTTTLNTINDFNSWLKNVRGKKIRINTHVVVTQDLVLTSNEYWVFGDRIDANVYVVEKNITIVSFAPLGNSYEERYVQNSDPITRKAIDASGLRLFAIYADLAIDTPYSLPPSIYEPVTIVLLSTTHSELIGITGDVVAQGIYLTMHYCKLGFTYIDVVEAYLANCVADNAVVLLKTRHDTYLTNVDVSNAINFLSDMRYTWVVDVPAGESASIDLDLLKPNWEYLLYIEQVGEYNEYTAPGGLYHLGYLSALPSGVSITVDAPTKSIVITNNTTNTVSVFIAYRIVSV